MTGIRIAVPDTAAKDEIIEIKALIQHDMESGFRRGSRGEVIPRDIIVLFECVYDGDTIFKANLNPGVSANPFLTFYTRATTTGDLEFRWTDQHGETWSETRAITVV